MPRLRFLLLALLAALVSPRPAAAVELGIRYFRSYRSPADAMDRTFTVRTPKGYSGTTRLPAALFLHGRGGFAGSFQQPEYFDAADAAGMVLIFWQGRPDPNGLMSSYYIDAANGIPDETDILACLDAAVAEFAIDPARVHLVGFSQGGKGALLVGLKNPDRFATVTEGAGPTDAFQGQKWSPTFPDFRDAAGGFASAGGAVLARWYGQSPRFYLAAARNLPLALRHGASDTVVPDSTLLFPYRNTHHVADTPGFGDERGVTPTLSELRAADPAGYSYETRYPAAVGHDELGVLDGPTVFAFFAGKSVPRNPERVVGIAYEAGTHGFYWAKLARLAPPDGTVARFSASRDLARNLLAIDATGAVDLTVDLARAGLDPARRLELRLSGTQALRLNGSFTASLVRRDGVLLREGLDYTRAQTSLLLPAASYGLGSALTIEAAPAGPVVASDLLVPAVVEAPGLNGAHFSSELTLANLGDQSATLEALLLDGSGRSTTIGVPPRRTLLLSSAALFAALGVSGGTAPLRLRGDRAVVASARVFNALPGGGTYGLSFPVLPAGESTVAGSADALFFGPSGTRPERMNVSLFAPFEAASGVLQAVSPAGAVLRSTPFALGTLERVQHNDVLSGLAPGATARLHVDSGRVQAYGTVVSSSATNDPFRSPAFNGAASGGWSVPAVAAATGRNAAFFSSDLYLSSAAAAADVELTFVPHAGPPVQAVLSLAPGETRLVADVLRTLFPARVPDYGALTFHSSSAVTAFAVTRSDAASGASSQDVACTPSGREISADAPAVFAGLTESPLARSNLTLVNLGAATSVTLQLVAEDGDRGQVTVTLAAGEFRQLDSVAALFAGGPVSTGALIVRPEAGARLAAAVARIDNATSDPTGLSGMPLP